VDSDSSTPSNLPARDNALQQRLLNIQFDSELEMFLELLKNTKDFLRRLPEDLCVSDDHSTRGKGMCWNGTSLVRSVNYNVIKVMGPNVGKLQGNKSDGSKRRLITT